MILVNGVAAAAVPATDRGLIYGDGLFETVAVRDGELLLWEAHLERLVAGCARLRIAVPDTTLLAREARTLCARPGRAVLRITLTRGSGGRGYRIDPEAEPTRILALHPWPDYPDYYRIAGVVIRLCTLRMAAQKLLAGIKHLNRLEQVLARAEWDDPDIAEGLVCDQFGHVIEGTMSNLFIVRAGRVMTPQLSDCGVAGIMRASLINAADELGLPLEITELSLDSVISADEIFLTNSVIGIWPVRRLDMHDYPPGEITRRFANALHNVIA